MDWTAGLPNPPWRANRSYADPAGLIADERAISALPIDRGSCFHPFSIKASQECQQYPSRRRRSIATDNESTCKVPWDGSTRSTHTGLTPSNLFIYKHRPSSASRNRRAWRASSSTGGSVSLGSSRRKGLLRSTFGSGCKVKVNPHTTKRRVSGASTGQTTVSHGKKTRPTQHQRRPSSDC